MNLRCRFKNKTFVVSFMVAVLAFVYQLLGMIGIVPQISEDTAVSMITMAANLLVGLGVLVDPTTPGICDCTSGQHTEEDEHYADEEDYTEENENE